MTVWKLLRVLLLHALHGRGKDTVYLRLEGLPDSAQEEQDMENWLLYDISWAGDEDAFVVLSAEPEREGVSL